jgi:hypothetical protein
MTPEPKNLAKLPDVRTPHVFALNNHLLKNAFWNANQFCPFSKHWKHCTAHRSDEDNEDRRYPQLWISVCASARTAIQVRHGRSGWGRCPRCWRSERETRAPGFMCGDLHVLNSNLAWLGGSSRNRTSLGDGPDEDMYFKCFNYHVSKLVSRYSYIHIPYAACISIQDQPLPQALGVLKRFRFINDWPKGCEF